MKTVTRHAMEHGVKVPVHAEPSRFTKIVVGPVDFEEEWWLLGPFRPIWVTHPSGHCANPERCSWQLGPSRCMHHELHFS